MSERVAVRIPKDLRNAGRGGRLAFTIELPDNSFAGNGWKRSCRLDGIAEEAGCTLHGEFHPAGHLQLMLPGDVAGEILPTLEFWHAGSGRRLSGAFTLKVNHQADSAVHVHAGGHQVEGSGVVYQPIEISGVAAGAVEVVGDKLKVDILLYEEDVGGAVPLEDLLEREEFLVLPDRGDGIARVLSVDVGPTLVVGRCYASQLHAKARARLEALRETRVQWVTGWDDPALNQVSAVLTYLPSGGEPQLDIRNVTDYSTRRQSVVVIPERGEERAVPPGANLTVPLPPDSRLVIVSGEGTGRRILAQLKLDEMPVAGGVVPVVRSTGTTFRYPPTGDRDATTVHYLGTWLPSPLVNLQRLLAERGAVLPVSFQRDGVNLWVKVPAGQRTLRVSSNIDLSACLGAR